MWVISSVVYGGLGIDVFNEWICAVGVKMCDVKARIEDSAKIQTRMRAVLLRYPNNT